MPHDITERPTPPPSPITLLRLPVVQARTGLSRTHIYRLVGDGTFPKPVRLGVRHTAWIAAEVEAWIGDTIARSRAAGWNPDDGRPGGPRR
jgi:predicted DNA-binding transcriptional regulator AlpA